MKILKKSILFLAATLMLIASTYLVTRNDPPIQNSDRRSLSTGSPVTALPSGMMSTAELLELWQSRYERDPQDYISLTYLGQAYIRKARETGSINYYLKAEDSIQQALAINPSDQTALQISSTVMLSKHDFQGALEIAERVYKYDPNALQALATIGDAHIELGNYQEAETAYLALADRSSHPAVTTRLARLAWFYGESDKAIALMEKAANDAIELGFTGESAAWYQFQLGDFYFDEGQLDLAEAHFKRSLQIYDHYFLALAGLGEVNAVRGDTKRAIVFYEQALEMSPNQPDLLSTIGYLYELEGRNREAQQAYEAVEDVATENAFNCRVYNRMLATFYADSDIKLDRALEKAEWEMTIREDVYGYDALAWTLYKKGRYQEASEASKRALELGTRDANLYYHAGMIHAALKNYQEAEKMLSTALEINPYFDNYQLPILRNTLDGLRANDGN